MAPLKLSGGGIHFCEFRREKRKEEKRKQNCFLSSVWKFRREEKDTLYPLCLLVDKKELIQRLFINRTTFSSLHFFMIWRESPH